MASIHPKINGRYILVVFVAVTSSWLLHEFAHWITGVILGYEMVMTLNSTYPSSGSYLLHQHYTIISAAGPLLTIIEAIIVFYLIKKTKQLLLYPFLFICFYMRFFATVISFLNPNDEARISSAIGLGKFTLPSIVSIFLLYLIYNVSKKFKLGARFHLLNFALVIVFSSVIILADQFFKLRLL